MVAIMVKRVNVMRQRRSSTIAANFQSFSMAAVSSSSRILSVITRISLRIRLSSRWTPGGKLPAEAGVDEPPPPDGAATDVPGTPSKSLESIGGSGGNMGGKPGKPGGPTPPPFPMGRMKGAPRGGGRGGGPPPLPPGVLFPIRGAPGKPGGGPRPGG